MAANDFIMTRIPIQNGELSVKNTHASTALIALRKLPAPEGEDHRAAGMWHVPKLAQWSGNFPGRLLGCLAS